MDYTVQIERLDAHGRDAGAAGTDATSTMRTARLDGAADAMPGSMSGAASRALHNRFESAAGTLSGALDSYVGATRAAVEGYRQQEDRASAAINQFFGS